MKKEIQIPFIRLSLVLLFAWFGVMQLIDPSLWVGFLPTWTGYFPMPGEMIVSLNGWFEVCGSLMMLLGVRTRIITTLLGLHLMGIAIAVGGAIGIRDAVLALVAISFAFAKPDSFTLDTILSKETVTPPAPQVPEPPTAQIIA